MCNENKTNKKKTEKLYIPVETKRLNVIFLLTPVFNVESSYKPVKASIENHGVSSPSA